MPLYDFDCGQHVFEALGRSDVRECPLCGVEARRVEVSPFAFALASPVLEQRDRVPTRKGEPVRNYLEAFQEVEYRASLTDDPEVAAVEEVVRPAYYRARARLASDGKHARYHPHRSIKATDKD